MIKPFTPDIRNWLKVNLAEDITGLEEEQRKSKNPNNKTSVDRLKRIESKTKRLKSLDSIAQFTYNPNSDNISKDSLNHTKVVSIAANFIHHKPLMQQLLACRFPILLIDESQDTKKELIDSIFSLQQKMKHSFCVGLFGDTMQRIYTDGKENLQKAFPKDWEIPSKKLNHRSNKRIISLINNIRSDVDNQRQKPRIEKQQGHVRLFISTRTKDKTGVEAMVLKKMSGITGDPLWNDDGNNVKRLILEHHMAAKRLGFLSFFEPLYAIPRFTTGMLDGTLPGISLFIKTILPLVNAHRQNDKYEMARIVKRDSPLFNAKEFKKSANQLTNIKKCNEATDKLLKLWDKGHDPIILDVLQKIYTTKLFSIPDILYPIVSRTAEEKTEMENNAETDEPDEDEGLKAWEAALEQKFSNIENYSEYLSEKSKFGTHQGVKGLEYPRVMVIVDDEEAKGFMFSYDKLFGTKDLTPTDKKNIAEGKETGIERTKRLFYVACSRARESLAIIAYSDDPSRVKINARNNSWFAEDEIEII